MPKPSDRHIVVQLSTREQKAAADALLVAAANAPKGSPFHQWAIAIATKIKLAVPVVPKTTAKLTLREVKGPK